MWASSWLEGSLKERVLPDTGKFSLVTAGPCSVLIGVRQRVSEVSLLRGVSS